MRLAALLMAVAAQPVRKDTERTPRAWLMAREPVAAALGCSRWCVYAWLLC